MRAELEEISEVWRKSPVSAISPQEILLVTDFDGTLADIGPDPALTVAVPDALDAVRRLSLTLKQVVVLSSRTSAELSRLVPVPGVRLIGDSGLPAPNPEEMRALGRFNLEASQLFSSVPGVRLETKPASTTVHLRAAQITGEEAMAMLRPVLKSAGLSGAQGRRVIEVHTPFAGKGTALATLLKEVDPGGVVSMGDDENDRAAFEVLSAHPIPHVCIGVSSPEVPANLFVRCDLVLDDPRQAIEFLQMLAVWASRPHEAGS